MQRDLASLADKTFDVLVIGGGVTGAFTALDAALRGLRVALVERGDFAGATSANSLKIVHGGLRHLQQLDFRRMREATRERSTWLRIAPHLVHPLPVVVPTYRTGMQRRSLMHAALILNDAISYDRNRSVPLERHLPPGRALSRTEVLELAPELASPSLTGGVLFYDAQMYSSERLVLSVVQAAENAGATVANYVEVEQSWSAGGRTAGAVVRDRIRGASFPVQARLLINTSGPATANVAHRLVQRSGSVRLRHSVALNLVILPRGHQVAFAITGRATRRDALIRTGKRQLFVVPWRNRTIVGTAHLPYVGDPARFNVDEDLVEEFRTEVNAAWPGRIIPRSDILLVHAGLVPVQDHGGASALRFLKRHQILDHAGDGVPEVISAVSIKFTTGRLVAEHAIDLAFRKLGYAPPPCSTASRPLPSSPDRPLAELVSEAHRRWGEWLDMEAVEHLVRTYGGKYEQILRYREHLPDWNQRVTPSTPVIKAQLVHGMREEMAQCPEDLILRRTELGALGQPGAAARAAAELVFRSEQRRRSKTTVQR